MKAKFQSALLALALLATPALAGSGTSQNRARSLSPSESASLRSIEEPRLGELRAGVVAAASAMPAVERAALGAAQERSPELQALRAGDLHLTDHDLKVIAIVVGIVLLIVIIA